MTTLKVTQTKNKLKTNVLATVAKYAPSVKTVVHCGIKAAELPLKEAKELAAQFTTNVSTPVGDMLMDWTEKGSEKVAEEATKWTISATELIAHKVSGR